MGRLRNICLFLFLICIAAPLSAAAAAPELDKAIAESQQLASQKKYKEALDALLEAVLYASGTDEARLHAARGAVYRMSGDIMKAIEEYDASVSSAPGDPCNRLEQALFFETVGEYGASLSGAELAVSAGCSQPALMSLMGRLYMWRDDPVNALDYFYEAMNDAAQRPPALREIGAVFMTFGFTDPAITYLKEAVALDPGDSVLFALLADANSMSGRLEESLDYYKRALELDSKNSIAANNYGYTLFLLGKTDDAGAVFERLNKDAPSPYSLCNVMELNVFKGNMDAARQAGQICIESIQKDPGFTDYERYYIGAAQRAVKLSYEDQQALHPKTQLDLMRQYESDGMLTEALSAALVVLMMEPDNSEALLEAGRIYMALGENIKGAPFLCLAAAKGGRNSDIAREARRLLFNNAFSSFGASGAGLNWFNQDAAGKK